ncbi:hypothetical protein AO888_31675 [Pseudomonas aeruginosa]|nr:hypothetical protein AO888_31675 [Pseudomonas aeruginosa]
MSWRSESPFTVGFRAYVGFWFHCSPNPIPASAKESKVPVRLESNTECAARIGAPTLGSAIEIATDAVSVPAPLRWL